MSEEKLLYSKSENLPVSDIRKLKELQILDKMLNEIEFLKIVSVYDECIDRLLKENGEEI